MSGTAMTRVEFNDKLYRVMTREGLVKAIDVWTPENAKGYKQRYRAGWWRQVSVKGATGKALAKHIEETGQ